MEEKIIVWIPVFNEANYLATTIQSVISQTYKNLHILISDNFSTDGSRDIIEYFASKDNRIQVIRPNKHCPSLEHVRYIQKEILSIDHIASLHMGGHDVLHTEYVERLVNKYLLNPSASIIVPNGVRLSDDGKPEGYYPVFPQLKDTPAFTNPFVVFSSVGYMVPFYGLIPKKIMEAVSIRHLCYAADLLFIAEISLYGPVIVDESAVIYCRAQLQNDSGPAGGQMKKSVGVEYKIESAIEQYRLQLAWIREIAIIGVKKFNWVNLDIYSVGLMGCYTARWAPIQFSQIQGCNALELWMQSPEGICLGKGLVNINCKINELLLG